MSFGLRTLLCENIMRAAFLGLLLNALVITAQPYNYGVDIETLTRRQDDARRIVVGRLPLATNGTVPLRPEIRQLKADPYKWDLFILALSMFQYVSQDDPTSWYQIAGELYCLSSRAWADGADALLPLGIHGVPFQPWNDVDAVPGANMSGYCPHSSVLFPTWHRPYLALFEVSLYVDGECQ